MSRVEPRRAACAREAREGAARSPLAPLALRRICMDGFCRRNRTELITRTRTIFSLAQEHGSVWDIGGADGGGMGYAACGEGLARVPVAAFFSVK